MEGFRRGVRRANADDRHQHEAVHCRKARRHTKPVPVPLPTVPIAAKMLDLKESDSSTVVALAQNDWALVLAKVCRADVKAAAAASGALPALTARAVLDKGQAQAETS